MSNKSKTKVWVIIGNEELPVALQFAKTSEGAMSIYRELSGDACECVHAEVAKFDKRGHYVFSSLR